jgi:hypothetical protein
LKGIAGLRKELFQYIAIYILCVLNGSMLFIRSKNVIVYTVIAVYLILMLLSRKYRNKEPIIICFILFTATVFVRLVSGEIGIEIFLLYSAQILIVFLCLQIDKKNFLQRFINIVVFLSAISLVFWLALLLFPELVKNILTTVTVIENKNGIVDNYYGVLLYTFSEDYGLERNAGIFSEPGRFQGILEGALWILMFLDDCLCISKKKTYLYIGIIIITILSTQSTAGYISLLAIIICYLLKGSRVDKPLKRMLILCMSIIGMLFIFDVIINGPLSLFNSVITDKLIDTDINDAASSGGARLRMMQICLDAIIEKPWGAGTIGAEGNIVSAGIMRLFAYFGVVPGGIVLFWMFRPFFKYNYPIIEIVTFIFVYINLGLAQTYAFYPGLLVVPVSISFMKIFYKKSE